MFDEMINTQLSIYDIEYEKFKINKPIRLIELFSGYGSQALALKYLGVNFEHWKTCEWAIKSIQAYKDIHFTNKDIELNNKRTKQDMINFLYQKGISNNYNDPMTKEQISRLSEDTLKTIIKNIAITHNLVNIQQVKGEDLEIVDTDKYCYIMTYSFPCQDLSLAGKGKGMSDTTTRSGMLWEVERILTETPNKPQVLLMENVPQVHSQDNLKDFNKWKDRLEELGYKNYFQDLIATDYGIPQTRNRCFMISLLGDYSYTFPKPIPLKLRLKDMLEDNIDEKYYLSDKMLDYCLGVKQKESKFPRGERFIQSLQTTNDKGLANTISTNAGNRPVDNFIKVKNATMGGENNGVVVNMKTKLCNDLIKEGKVKENDVIRHSYTTQRNENWDTRNVEQNNLSPTLDTRCDCLGVCVGTYQYAKSDNFMQGKDRLQLGKELSDTLQTTPKEGVVTIGNYSPSKHNASRVVDQNYSAPTVMDNHGTTTAVVDKPHVIGGIGEKDSNNNTQWKQQNRIYDNNVAISVTTAFNPYYNSDLRIRKLTPKECFRLMGVKDEDYDNVCKNQSDSSLYHLAGDSIVVNVLMAIFGEML